MKKVERLGNTNKCEFSVDLDPAKVGFGVQRAILKVIIEQDGVLPRYTVSQVLSSMARWNWSDKIIESKVVDGKENAWDLYKALRKAVLEGEHIAVLGEEIEKRPVGISDPNHKDYVACNLTCVKSEGRQAGRCFYISDNVWARADGQTVTQDDIDALKLRAYGQVHIVKAKPGDLTINVHTECDSGD